MNSKRISKTDTNTDQTSQVLSQTVAAALEGITGLAASDKTALLLSLGRILQRVRGGRFLQQLKSEWDGYRETGRVGDAHFQSEQGRECLQELLDFLDGDAPDRLRFDALKRAFLKSASTETADLDSVLPQQYMRMIRSLTSGEAVLLFAAYRNSESYTSAVDWLIGLAARSPLRFPELVELHEEGLMKKQLLTKRLHSDRSGIHKGPHDRLTAFGYSLCKYIEADTLELVGGNDT